MTKKQFEGFVVDGMNHIPEKFQKKIQNVAIFVSDEPTPQQREENGLSEQETLLGLYEGIPLTERGVGYGNDPTLPDKIYIFRKPIEEEAGNDPERMRKIVAETLWHEIAHYFGMDENTVQKRENDMK